MKKIRERGERYDLVSEITSAYRLTERLRRTMPHARKLYTIRAHRRNEIHFPRHKACHLCARVQRKREGWTDCKRERERYIALRCWWIGYGFIVPRTRQARAFSLSSLHIHESKRVWLYFWFFFLSLAFSTFCFALLKNEVAVDWLISNYCSSSFIIELT